MLEAADQLVPKKVEIILFVVSPSIPVVGQSVRQQVTKGNGADKGKRTLCDFGITSQ